MVFGQPQFLPLLALASLPLLIHLLARRQRRIVKFSMTRFLQEVAQQTQGRRWLRELLLLLLRTGAVLFALMTLVRPYAPVPLPLPPALTSIAIVLDNSLSMQSRNLKGQKQTWFDQARGWCERALKELPAEIALLAADSPSEPICDFTEDVSKRLRSLRQIRPTFKALDLSPALQIADSLLVPRSAAVKQVVVVTDLQSEPFRSLSLPKLKNSLTVVDVKPNEKVTNVRLIAELRLPLDPNTDGRVIVEVQNLSRQPAEGTIVSSIREKPFADMQISLSLISPKIVNLPFPVWVLDATGESGLVDFEVRWKSLLDNFEWDDFVRFAFKSPKYLRVVNAVREGRFYVDAALRAVGINPTLTASFKSADVVIASAPTDRNTAQNLANWLRKGGSAIVVADSINSPLWEMLGIAFQISRNPQRQRIRWVDESNPVLKGLGASLQSVTVSPSVTVKNEPSSFKVLLALPNRTPILIELAVGSGRCYLLTVSLNPQRTDLVHSPSFVPLLYRLVRSAVYGSELRPTETEAKPEAKIGSSTVVPKSESEFRLPSRSEVASKLKGMGGTLIDANHPPRESLAETDLKDLTNFCLLLALLCLLTETILTLLWWKRAR